MGGWHTTTPTSRGYGPQWRKARAAALMRDMHLCQVCLKAGRPTPATEVDHIIPRAKGGTDALDNLQAICRDCHNAKTAADSGRTYRKPRTYGLDGWPLD